MAYFHSCKTSHSHSEKKLTHRHLVLQRKFDLAFQHFFLWQCFALQAIPSLEAVMTKGFEPQTKSFLLLIAEHIPSVLKDPGQAGFCPKR